MKISRIRHVLITSIIFLIIIGIIVAVYSSSLRMLRNSTVEEVYRIVALKDIEPGETISINNVERVTVANVVSAENMLYKMNAEDANQEFVKVDETNQNRGKSELWAIGKVANQKIYKGEWLSNNKVSLKSNVVPTDTRLYSIPLESETTGGYNISVGENVDICVLYTDDERTISDYQTLSSNKVIDIVLAEKRIADIRDESGNSAIGQPNAGVVPGYVCFNLTYEEINKIELAKRQGTLFIGKPGNYYEEGTQPSTFMPGANMPNF